VNQEKENLKAKHHKQNGKRMAIAKGSRFHSTATNSPDSYLVYSNKGKQYFK
jgi:hypothetical protein